MQNFGSFKGVFGMEVLYSLWRSVEGTRSYEEALDARRAVFTAAVERPSLRLLRFLYKHREVTKQISGADLEKLQKA
jgi:hypothetical protein